MISSDACASKISDGDGGGVRYQEVGVRTVGPPTGIIYKKEYCNDVV